ncbi:MAG: LytTR family DNA-binding domain-containing protein [Acidobacteriota bacterium]|nr:LytTR family DNA-binding domain-containing protein [Acidobacteriota bacterium]
MRDRATLPSPVLATTLSAIIVDDERLASEELAWLLKDFPEVEVLATGRNGIEALDLIEKLEPEIAFLDIQMPGLDGLGVVRRLREKNLNLPYFISSTAFDHYAVEAFRLEAMDYLLKPIDKARLSETIERARRLVGERALEVSAESAAAAVEPELYPRASHPRSKLMVRSANRNFIIDAQDLIYATIADGVITLVAANVEGLSNYRTLEDLQANLDAETFWRTHRSFLVNVNRIREVVPWFNSSYQVRMDDKKGTEIPVSRVQTRRLRELLKL